MYKEILDLIYKYETIIIHRHINPDIDALGSQLGLKRIIEINYPTKKVYVVGDENNFEFSLKMDVINDEIYSGALAIIVDVAVSNLVSDNRYNLADHVLVIDHHLNESDIVSTQYIDSSYVACAQIISDIVLTNNLLIDDVAATYLYSGLVTDSGRFLYPNTNSRTFEIAAFLSDKKADIQYVYDMLYTETLNYKKLKGHFINNFKTTKSNVAYMKNDNYIRDKYNVSSFTISRAMVNQMAGIKDIPIWANFTMFEDGLIQCELRSKKIPIVEIAKKYGGGGHALACGCTVKSFEEADLILYDLDKLLEKENIHG